MIVSFEGIDGSGKSTQARRLARKLAELDVDVHLVREPGGTPVSERIRELLLDASLEMDPFAEMLLYSAARADLVRNRLRAVNRSGSIVICDRFFDSTVAYQGGGRGIADMDWLDAFQRQVTEGLVPDRTYLIRVGARTARERQQGREKDRMERADIAFFERVIKAYDVLAEKCRDRIKVIDGEADADRVAESVWGDLSSLTVFRDAYGRSS